jgi:hypothetical protein
MGTVRLRAVAIAIIAGLVMMVAPGAASADFTVTEGHQFSGVVGSVVCVFNAQAHEANCTGTVTADPINWGDGTSSAATLTKVSCSSQIPNATGQCEEVHGAHTYENQGSYSGSATITNGESSSQINFTATVNLASLTLGTPNVTRSGNDVTLTASLTDGDPDHDNCDYTATIDWGDGNTTDGTVEPTSGQGESCVIEITRQPGASGRDVTGGGGAFTVSGTHTYTQEPSSDVAQVTVTDNADGQVAGPVDSNPIP